MTVLTVMIAARVPALTPVALALSGERTLDGLMQRIQSH
jgi:hypothetical protein